MNGNLEPEDRIMSEPTIVEQLSKLIDTLGWSIEDDVKVEVGGTAISGIHQAEGVNPRWSRQFGERVYNKDAFIVIKNLSRSPKENTYATPEVRETTEGNSQ
tara:strand:+ start:204 stop:509 length:306 start_codon:yes stop_codon:yes gene_type:complete